jgi:hypothetical protein
MPQLHKHFNVSGNGRPTKAFCNLFDLVVLIKAVAWTIYILIICFQLLLLTTLCLALKYFFLKRQRDVFSKLLIATVIGVAFGHTISLVTYKLNNASNDTWVTQPQFLILQQPVYLTALILVVVTFILSKQKNYANHNR